jgi:hypothetical protein
VLPIETHDQEATRWSYLFSAVQVHTTTHCRFYREQHCVLHLLRPVLDLTNYSDYAYIECIAIDHQTRQGFSGGIGVYLILQNVAGFVFYFSIYGNPWRVDM